MKKFVSLFLIVLLLGVFITGCGQGPDSNVIVVGASPDPHGKMLELVKEDLKDAGYELKIVEFTDYVKPNLALNSKELDANFFQHLPYLEDFNAENNLDLVSIGYVHIEPITVYSNKVSSLDDLPDGAQIAIPNDTVNGRRALLLLEDNGLIKLDEAAGNAATEKDIVENPKNLEFISLEATQLPRSLDDVDAAIINGNYALQAGLSPTDDGILMERKDSPYANIVAVRKGEENDAKLQALINALQSEKIKNFIEETYGDNVLPTF